jgi:hypothetical protein
MVELSGDEIDDLLQNMHDLFSEIVERTLRDGNNPSARAQPYPKCYKGLSTFTVGIEGLITGPNREFMQAVEELAPGSDFKNEALPDGKPGGWKVHLPFSRQRKVAIPQAGQGMYRRRVQQIQGRKPPTLGHGAPSAERIMLLWVVTGLLAAALYFRVRTTLLY